MSLALAAAAHDLARPPDAARPVPENLPASGPAGAAVLDPLAELAGIERAPHRIQLFCAGCGFSRLLHAGVNGDGPGLVASVACPGWRDA